MKFFDQFNLLQKIVMLVILMALFITLLSPPQTGYPRRVIDAGALVTILLAEVLIGGFIIAVVAVVRDDRAKRRRQQEEPREEADEEDAGR